MEHQNHNADADRNHMTEAKAFLDRLNSDGVMLAMVLKNERWVGIRQEDCWWRLVEGLVPASEISDSHLCEVARHCFFRDYTEAMDAFFDWWKADFLGVPSTCGEGSLLAH